MRNPATYVQRGAKGRAGEAVGDHGFHVASISCLAMLFFVSRLVLSKGVPSPEVWRDGGLRIRNFECTMSAA